VDEHDRHKTQTTLAELVADTVSNGSRDESQNLGAKTER